MNWREQLQNLLDRSSDYTRANATTVQSAVRGQGVDSVTVDSDAGARMVCNLASVHVPPLVMDGLRGGRASYKNGYDLGNFCVGDPVDGRALKKREIVDRALPLPSGQTPATTYFGAVELNGAGIRFYGDFCLVLRRGEIDPATVVLDRNSYDLIRSPINDSIEQEAQGSNARLERLRSKRARELAGEWGADLAQMAAGKVLAQANPQERRLTTGTVSDGVLKDEDYLEVLRAGSFNHQALQEARYTAADAAQDALVNDRLRSGPAPSLETLLWQDRRRRAEDFLQSAGVPVRVVTTAGRVRS